MSNSPFTFLGSLIVAIVMTLGCSEVQGSIQHPSAALSFDRGEGFRGELVGLRFLERVEGSNRSIFINEDNIGKYRMGVATIAITKPAGAELTIACADVTLHYYYDGDSSDVLPCIGLSTFSTVENTDREIELRPVNTGPGLLKKATRSASNASSAVFIDAVFTGLEPTTREAWIAIGNVDAPGPFIAEGWELETGGADRCASTSAIEPNSSVNGSWTSSCDSAHRANKYARFFTFSLGSETSVEIELESDDDTYLYLLRGSGSSGDVVTSDDDGGSGTDSRIRRRLARGTYTIEATTYDDRVTGSFTVRLESG